MSTKAKINSSYVTLVILGLIAAIVTISLLAKTYPLFTAKALYFCQQFVSNNLFKIPHSLPGAMILSVWAILSLGIISFAIQITKTYGLLNNISGKRVRLSHRLSDIAESVGIKNRVQLIKDNNLYSFCFGLFKPQIAISTGLVNTLSDKELEAVLLHERVHLQNHDPLKILIGKTIASAFFFLPIFKELYKNMEAANELIADQMTAHLQHDSRFLRSALRKIIAQPQVAFSTVPAISHPDHIEIRVRQLVNSPGKIGVGISYTSIATSMVFLIVSLFVLQTPVDAFHTEDSEEPSFFVCSVDNACRDQCHHNASMSSMSEPEQLFTSASSQPTPKYEAPSYR